MGGFGNVNPLTQFGVDPIEEGAELFGLSRGVRRAADSLGPGARFLLQSILAPLRAREDFATLFPGGGKSVRSRGLEGIIGSGAIENKNQLDFIQALIDRNREQFASDGKAKRDDPGLVPGNRVNSIFAAKNDAGDKKFSGTDNGFSGGREHVGPPSRGGGTSGGQGHLSGGKLGGGRRSSGFPQFF
jgi:hypothetical protein